MKSIEELLIEATKKMDSFLPNNIRCVIVFLDESTGEVSATSDMHEDEAAIILEEGAKVFKNPATALPPRKKEAAN